MHSITVKELIKLKRDNVNLNEVIVHTEEIKAQYLYVLEEQHLSNSYVHCSIPEFDYGKEYLFAGDRQDAVLIPIIREDYDTTYDYNNLIIIDSDVLDKCDVCNKASIKDILMSISPEITNELGDLNEEFNEFDGFMCIECYKSSLSKEYEMATILS